jgi:uncharacterized protein YneF (UPF0154 family)
VRIKKILILAITLLLLFALCINVFAAKKAYKSFDGFSKKSIVKILKKSPKIVDKSGDDGMVVIQRYRGSW